MENLVVSGFKLGVIAGGQLGKMLALAASNWDIRTYVLDEDEYCPASSVCTKLIRGSRHSFDDVYRFGHMVDMITYEIEDINTDALMKLKSEGKKILPDPDTLKMINDKGLQKMFYSEHSVPTMPFVLCENKNEIIDFLKNGKISFPFVQKLRKGGYDGRGVCVIKSESDMKNLLEGPSVIEEMADLKKEISVIVARNLRGEVRCFPIVEMEFNEKANLVENLVCPALTNENINAKAIEIAGKVITELRLCGLLAVELFLDNKDDLWVNEIAPRPHNSGHHTIESVITSQFEQLLRAIFNFPLGSTKLKMPAIMINILGEPDYEGDVKYEGLTECMAIEGVKIHLYGKKKTKPFRKMGHVTVLAPTIEEAREKSEIVKNKLKVKSW